MRLILGACFGLGLAVACGDGDSRPQGATNNGTGGAARGGTGGASTQSGGKTSTGGEHTDAGEGNTVNQGGAAGRDGPAGGDATAGGDGPAGGEPSLGTGGSGAAGAGNSTGGSREPMFPCDSDSVKKEPSIAAVCAPGSDFILGNAVPVDAGNAARLIAITPDELSIAWASFGSSIEQYFVADRASSEEAFDAPVRIETTGSVVGMSPDGLRLVTLSSDRHAYAELTRGADEPWPVGEPVPGCEFETHGAVVRHPTGIAADGLTLFFYDPDRGSARAAWRTDRDAPFSFFRDLPGVGLVVPAAACDKLYYSGSVGQTPLLFAKNGH